HMKKRKKLIIWIIVLAVFGSGIYYYLKPKDVGPEYTTEKAIRTDLQQTVSVTGEVVDIVKADVSPEISGTTEELAVKVGDRVEKGQKIAKINDSVVRSQLNEALIALQIQQEQLDLKRRKWDTLKPEEKEAAKLAVESARATTWTLQKQMKKNIVYAPIDGIIAKKYLEEGEMATMGKPLVTISGEKGFEIEADVPESDIDKIKIGQKGQATFDAFLSDEIFEFEVTEVEPTATIIQDVVYYRVTFKILTEEKRIKSGMSTDIDILTAEKKDVLAVSNQAIKNEDGKRYVEILETGTDQQKTVRRAGVKAGLRGDSGLTEIVSGLSEGEEVITFVKESK
ncbi:MAG: efflux RND transporter periplasmic adaptor subunit, partial [Candidatus Moranbacteria bacterium]|nr:efflux RND transporter periplasmic adaptor subunit [Candidatus Moranbacteria bacterium]